MSRYRISFADDQVTMICQLGLWTFYIIAIHTSIEGKGHF